MKLKDIYQKYPSAGPIEGGMLKCFKLTYGMKLLERGDGGV